MPIYTRTGDKGETGFVGGRISKHSSLINLVGELDEFNSGLGLTLSEANLKPQLKNQLKKLQSVLLHMGGLIASPQTDHTLLAKALIKTTLTLETEIDAAWKKLPALQGFVLPGGTGGGAWLHWNRTLCRRAERTLVAWIDEVENSKSIRVNHNYTSQLNVALQFLNRLSDWLFAQARKVNKNKEQIWNKELDWDK